MGITFCMTDKLRASSVTLGHNVRDYKSRSSLYTQKPESF